MYVCVCNGVTERDIRQAVADGCATLGDLTMRTGCGTNCGSCLAMAAELLAEAAPIDAPPALMHVEPQHRYRLACTA